MLGSHPLARYPQACRVLPHTLVDIGDLLGADRFSYDGTTVVFRRGGRGGISWAARPGDWLVLDTDGWRIVSDAVVCVA